MPTIKEILQEESRKDNNELVLFLEGKFWKAYERSAYVLTKLYNFKPSKRYIKLVYDLILRLVHEVRKMDKDFRYSIGQDLKTDLMRVEICIYHANEERESIRKKYAMLAEQMVEIEKHLNDWKQYYSHKIN